MSLIMGNIKSEHFELFRLRYAIKHYKIVILLLILIFIPVLSWAWSGKLVGVADGDTIAVFHDGKGEKVRLYGIGTSHKNEKQLNI